jgi:hypothetical protein
MRAQHKPDLLFIIIVFVGFGVMLSSYIQHMRANPTPSHSAAPAAELPVAQINNQINQLVLVSTPVQTEFLFNDDYYDDFGDSNGVVVNNSLQEP